MRNFLQNLHIDNNFHKTKCTLEIELYALKRRRRFDCIRNSFAIENNSQLNSYLGLCENTEMNNTRKDGRS